MCDMCSSPETVYRIELEGTRLNVCEKCASYGKVLGRIRQEEPIETGKKQRPSLSSSGAASTSEDKPLKSTETVQLIVKGYPKLIKDAREKLGLKQEELGKKIAERESVIHKLESGQLKPGISLARKLERFLRINLIEEVEVDSPGISTGAGGSSEGLTLGDLIKKKQK